MSTIDSNKSSSIIGPLNFVDPQSKHIKLNEVVDVPCLFCDTQYQFNKDVDNYLAHLFLAHRFVIGDVHQISILVDYLNYWQQKFKGKLNPSHLHILFYQNCNLIVNADNDQLVDFCTVLLLDQLPDGRPSKAEKYYLLSNDLPEDYDLRKKLHIKQLEAVLTQHQFERSDQSFERDCLLCRDIIKPNRAAFVQHLFVKHFLQLGKSENLVFIDELIDDLQTKLEQFICLFCERTFRDRITLKEHMRKKGHKRINPDNKAYDRYFLVNYQTRTDPQALHKYGKISPSHLRKPRAAPLTLTTAPVSQSFADASKVFQSDCSDSDWSDWEGEKQSLTCLFCPKSSVDFKKFKCHLKSEHTMDFDGVMSGLTFYQKVKVVNYIRRLVHTMQCIGCDEKFETSGGLLKHMETDGHFSIGKKDGWDQPEYFFPTYEDDAVLFHLEDSNEYNAVDDDASVVISEESKVTINADAEALSKERLLSF